MNWCIYDLPDFDLAANSGLFNLGRTSRVKNLLPDLAPCGQVLVDKGIASFICNLRHALDFLHHSIRCYAFPRPLPMPLSHLWTGNQVENSSFFFFPFQISSSFFIAFFFKLLMSKCHRFVSLMTILVVRFAVLI